MGGFERWIDPNRDVVLDARNLRGLAHPVRVRLLGALRHDGPSTATRLGHRLGLSSGATSYHLRQLAGYGFVVEDEDHRDAPGRERWWRAAHRSTWLTEPPDDPESSAALSEYGRALARSHAERVDAWLDEEETAPAAWRRIGGVSDTLLLLDAGQAEELAKRILEVLASYPRADGPEPGSEPGPGERRPVVVQWHLLPQLQDGPDTP